MTKAHDMLTKSLMAVVIGHDEPNNKNERISYPFLPCTVGYLPRLDSNVL